jgi:riboflavin synthase
MFTGIVEEQGEVRSLDRAEGSASGPADAAVLRVRAGGVAAGVAHGASIAVDGVCLTVIGQSPVAGSGLVDLDFDVMGETLVRSSIGDLTSGARVNLERAARVDSRLDGHIVQGHVDGTGRLHARTPAPAWELLRFEMPSELARYVAEKGSIAVNGVSLTVTAVGLDAAGDWFEVGLIPETLRATDLGRLAVGARVNLEVDVLAKYTERLLSARSVDASAGGTATTNGTS